MIFLGLMVLGSQANSLVILEIYSKNTLEHKCSVDHIHANAVIIHGSRID